MDESQQLNQQPVPQENELSVISQKVSNLFSSIRNSSFLKIFVFLVVVGLVGVTVLLSQTRQETRQHADSGTTILDLSAPQTISSPIQQEGETYNPSSSNLISSLQNQSTTDNPNTTARENRYVFDPDPDKDNTVYFYKGYIGTDTTNCESDPTTTPHKEGVPSGASIEAVVLSPSGWVASYQPKGCEGNASGPNKFGQFTLPKGDSLTIIHQCVNSTHVDWPTWFVQGVKDYPLTGQRFSHAGHTEIDNKCYTNGAGFVGQSGAIWVEPNATDMSYNFTGTVTVTPGVIGTIPNGGVLQADEFNGNNYVASYAPGRTISLPKGHRLGVFLRVVNGTISSPDASLTPISTYTLTGNTIDVSGVVGAPAPYTSIQVDIQKPAGGYDRTITGALNGPAFSVNPGEKIIVIRRVVNAKATFKNISLKDNSGTELLSDTFRQEKTLTDDVRTYQTVNWLQSNDATLPGPGTYTLNGTISDVTPIIGAPPPYASIQADIFTNNTYLSTSGMDNSNNAHQATFTISSADFSAGRRVAIIRRVVNSRATFKDISVTYIPESAPTLTPSPTDVPVISPSPTPTSTSAPTATPTLTPSPTITPTPPPGNNSLSFNLKLGAIGAAGENTNPLTKERQVSVQVIDSSDHPVGDLKIGTIAYQTASASGRFTGTVNMGSLQPGNYYFKIKTDRYLKRKTSLVAVTASTTTYDIAQLSLIPGDINGDNKIDISDYNIILNCFVNDDGTTPQECGNDKLNADLDDNGIVDGVDYNIFISSLSTKEGD